MLSYPRKDHPSCIVAIVRGAAAWMHRVPSTMADPLHTLHKLHNRLREDQHCSRQAGTAGMRSGHAGGSPDRTFLGRRPSVDSSPSPAKSKKTRGRTGQLELSDQISRLPCEAIHTPTIMIVKVVQQLISSKRLHVVGPPRTGNLESTITENITAYGAMFKSPIDWGLKNIVRQPLLLLLPLDSPSNPVENAEIKPGIARAKRNAHAYGCAGAEQPGLRCRCRRHFCGPLSCAT